MEIEAVSIPVVPTAAVAEGQPSTPAYAGYTLIADDLGLLEEPRIDGFFVKEAVLPFKKFLGMDALLGPEMRSTGEVMGIGWSFGGARAKSMKAANYGLPKPGKAFLSVRDADKQVLIPIARERCSSGVMSR